MSQENRRFVVEDGTEDAKRIVSGWTYLFRNRDAALKVARYVSSRARLQPFEHDGLILWAAVADTRGLLYGKSRRALDLVVKP